MRGRRDKDADLSCSRNARPQKALVGRAQVRFSVLTPLSDVYEQAWMEHC
jgi:hypothetical protein